MVIALVPSLVHFPNKKAVGSGRVVGFVFCCRYTNITHNNTSRELSVQVSLEAGKKHR